MSIFVVSFLISGLLWQPVLMHGRVGMVWTLPARASCWLLWLYFCILSGESSMLKAYILLLRRLWSYDIWFCRWFLVWPFVFGSWWLSRNWPSYLWFILRYLAFFYCVVVLLSLWFAFVSFLVKPRFWMGSNYHPLLPIFKIPHLLSLPELKSSFSLASSGIRWLLSSRRQWAPPPWLARFSVWGL